MMRALLLLLFLAPQTDPVVDTVLREGKTHSEVMDHLDHLVNRIGPRLTSSEKLTRACEWTKAKFEAWGLKARLEEWGTFPVGFERGPWSAKMTAPEELHLTIGTPAWSPGTDGPVAGPAVLAPANDEELKAAKEKLKGAWVISTTRGPDRYQVAYDEAGIAGLIKSTPGELIVTSGNSRISWDKLPRRVTVQMVASHHKKIVEHLKAGREVKLTIDIKNEFKQGPIKLYNVIADLPGAEIPDEYVIIGGHIDSWDGATGTTDNGTGVATTLEAARLLARAGARPRRTIRFMFWSGEEQGLLGSRAYVKAHPDEVKKTSAVIVHDGGTNYVSGINATEAMVPIFEKVFAPILNLDPEKKFTLRKVGGLPRGIGSDHDSYLAAGAPGFFWNQAGRAKYTYTHHTQNDHFVQAIPEYQKHSAMVIAVGAWGLANLPGMLPREGLAGPAPRGRRLGVQLDENYTVTEVVEDGIAHKSGVKVGDKLLKLNDKPLFDIPSLREAMNVSPKEGKLVVSREGKEVALSVTFPE